MAQLQLSKRTSIFCRKGLLSFPLPPFLPMILRPIAQWKFSMRTSIFLISGEYLPYLPLPPYLLLILSPMAQGKLFMRSSVFFISVENLFTYLFTWSEVSNRPGRASQETSSSGMSSASVVFVHTLSFHACSSGRSQLLILLLELLTLVPCSHFVQLSTTSNWRSFSWTPCGPAAFSGCGGLPCCESLSPRPLPSQTTAPGQAHLFCWLFCGPWLCLPGAGAPQGWASPAKPAFHCTQYSLVLTPFLLPSVALSPGMTCPPLSTVTRLVLRIQGVASHIAYIAA